VGCAHAAGAVPHATSAFSFFKLNSRLNSAVFIVSFISQEKYRFAAHAAAGTSFLVSSRKEAKKTTGG